MKSILLSFVASGLLALTASAGSYTLTHDTSVTRTIKAGTGRLTPDNYRIEIPQGRRATVVFVENSRKLSDSCTGITVGPAMSGVVHSQLEGALGERIWVVSGNCFLSISVMGSGRYGDWSASVKYSLNVTFSGEAGGDCEEEALDWPDGGIAASAITTPFWDCFGATYCGKVMRGGSIVGTLRLKVGRMHNLKSKVSATYSDISGKKVSSSSATVACSEKGPALVTLNLKGFGPLRLRLGQGEFAGTLGEVAGGFYTVEDCDICGFASTDLRFTMDGVSVSNGELLRTDLLPLDVPLQLAGKKLAVVGENPSKLKLSFTTSTGRVSGSFKAFTEKPNGKLRSHAFKIRGFIADGVAYLSVVRSGSLFESGAVIRSDRK